MPGAHGGLKRVLEPLGLEGQMICELPRERWDLSPVLRHPYWAAHSCCNADPGELTVSSDFCGHSDTHAKTDPNTNKQ